MNNHQLARRRGKENPCPFKFFIDAKSGMAPVLPTDTMATTKAICLSLCLTLLMRCVRENNIVHCLIDPGKPQQNPFVERSHREDQEKFYEQNQFKSFEELKYKLRIWNMDYNMDYNNTKHCGLNGLTPNQALRL